jgi:gamma-glutamylputrescine oxidase
VIPVATRWALSGTLDADVCVLGGGMTGCAAALELASRESRVVLLEANAVGAGASGRNLGHIATGLGCHYEAAITDLGREGAREVWETNRHNHARIRECLTALRADCGYEPRGGFAIALDREEARELAESEDLLRDDGFSGEFLDHYMLETRFAAKGLAGGYWSADDAAIDGLAFTRTLAAAAEAKGARLFEGSPVQGLESGGPGIEVRTAGGVVRAGVAIVALNAFAPPLVPFLKERIRPLRGQCVAFGNDGTLTLPTPAYADRGRVYWRLTDDRLLVGGFDDLALEEESTAALGTTDLIQHAIETFARENLGAVAHAVIQRWSGIMGISVDGFPFIGPIPGTPLIAAAGFTALGFGYAMLAARWAAEAACTGRDETPARYRAARPLSPRPWPPWNVV